MSSFSPVKIEFAPARKASACASALIESLPALSRTMALGSRILATAMARIHSKMSS